jgi:hypothetical protein
MTRRNMVLNIIRRNILVRRDDIATTATFFIALLRIEHPSFGDEKGPDQLPVNLPPPIEPVHSSTVSEYEGILRPL